MTYDASGSTTAKKTASHDNTPPDALLAFMKSQWEAEGEAEDRAGEECSRPRSTKRGAVGAVPQRDAADPHRAREGSRE